MRDDSNRDGGSGLTASIGYIVPYLLSVYFVTRIWLLIWREFRF